MVEHNRVHVFHTMVETIDIALSLPACIWLLDDQDPGALRVEAASGVTQDFIDNTVLRIDQPGIPAHVFETRKSIEISDLATNPRWTHNKAETDSMGLKSAYIAPLVFRHEVVGLLTVFISIARDFQTSEKILIDSFALQAAATFRRLRELRALSSTALILTSQLNSAQLLKNILDAVAQVLDCSKIGLYLLQPNGDLKLEAAFPAGIQRERFKPGEGLAGLVCSTGESLIVPNVRESAQFLPGGTPSQDESMLVVPIKLDDEVVGIISADLDRLDGFDEHDQSLLETVASQASVGLQNSELFRQRAILSEIVRNISAATDRDQLIQSIVARSTELVNHAQAAAIGLLDPVTQIVQFSYNFGWGIDGAPPIVEKGQGLTGRAIATREPVMVGDVTHDPDYVSHVEGINSELLVPLTEDNNVIGILSFQSREYNAFDVHDRSIAVLLADHAAMALHKIRLFERIQSQLNERSNYLNALELVYTTIADQQPYDQILKILNQQALDFTPADNVSLWIPDWDAGEIRLRSHLNYDTDEIGRSILLDATSIIAHTLRENKVYLCRDVSVDPNYMPGLAGIQSELAIPIEYRDQVIGVLNAESREPNAFTDEHVNFLNTLAIQAGIAMQISRLQAQSRAAMESAEAVGGILSLEELSERILDIALEMVGAPLGTIEFIDWSTNELVVHAARGRSEEVDDAASKRHPIHSGVTGLVVKNKKSRLVQDVSQEPGFLHYLTNEGSEAAVPIILGGNNGRILGVINVEHPRPKALDDHTIVLLEAIARQIADKVHNMRLLNNRQIISSVGEALTRQIETDQGAIIEAVYNRINKAMDTNNMYIALYDEATDIVRFALAYIEGERIDVQNDPKWQPRRAGRGRTEWIIKNKKPIFQPTREEGQKFYDQAEHKEYIGTPLASWMGVPIFIGDKVFGVIATYHPDFDHVYDEQDLNILTDLADYTAIALQNAELYRQVTTRLDMVDNIAREMMASYSVDMRDTVQLPSLQKLQSQIFEYFHEKACEIINTNNMYIALYDEVTDTVYFGLVYDKGERIDVEADPHYRPRKGGRGRVEHIIKTRQALFHPTRRDGEDFYNKEGHQEYTGTVHGSWMGVPMIAGDRVLGVLITFDPDREHAYDSTDLQFLQSLGAYMAIALDNVNLYFKLNRKLGALLDVTSETVERGIRSDTDEIFEHIAQHISNILEIDSFFISLYDRLRRRITFDCIYINNQRRAPEELEGFKSRVDGHGRLEWIIENRQPIVHSTRQERENWYKARNYEIYPIWFSEESWIGVPMIAGGQVWGVLAGVHPDQFKFDGDDLELLMQIAKQTALALHSAELAREVTMKQQMVVLELATGQLQHKIKNMLATLPPNIRSLRRNLESKPGIDIIDETIGKSLDIIEQSASESIKIFNSLLRYLRLGKEDVPLPIMINTLLRDEINDFEKSKSEQELADKQLVVELAPDETMPLLSLVSARFSEIFRNLIDNAWRYTPKKGMITISSTVNTRLNAVDVRVTNTGEVISPDVRKALFKRPMTGEPDQPSTGVGLWLSALYLESLGGSIDIEEPEMPGQFSGTTFLVRLPYMQGSGL